MRAPRLFTEPVPDVDQKACKPRQTFDPWPYHYSPGLYFELYMLEITVRHRRPISEDRKPPRTDFLGEAGRVVHTAHDRVGASVGDLRDRRRLECIVEEMQRLRHGVVIHALQFELEEVKLPSSWAPDRTCPRVI